ncbi:MAG: DUF21 domain-containing protein [Phycisphaerales bacterium]|nr:DUF21 domain-containing protein [Phycisphaerales bacterium]
MSIGMNAMLATLPIFVCMSACCSASETVFFGLTADDRWQIQRDRPHAGRLVEQLLGQPRRLLLTLLLSNVTVNSIFFAVATVVLAETELSVYAKVGIGICEVIGLILFGELLPKLVGNSLRLRLAPFLARPVLVLSFVVAPIRAIIEFTVFLPLHRLTAHAIPKSGPTAEELRGFVSAAQVQGDISVEEEALLGRLLVMRRARVRDVMTHRTEMASISSRALRAEVARVALATRLKRLPVVDGSRDRVLGILDVRGFLLDPRGIATPIEAHLNLAVFVPEIASLEQLFELFRSQRSSLAIVVDEFGGTAGVVALEDAIEEIVGDIAARDEVAPAIPQQLDGGSTRIDPKMSAAAFCAHFGLPLTLTRASTVGGIALEQLEDLPTAGACFNLGPFEIRAETVERGRASSFVVRRTAGPGDSSAREDPP